MFAKMKNAFFRVNPVIVGVLAMFAIAFAYVEIQPKYLPVATDTDSVVRGRVYGRWGPQ
jgi:hypothetical protein